jgi:hypothetical protein
MSETRSDLCSRDPTWRFPLALALLSSDSVLEIPFVSTARGGNDRCQGFLGAAFHHDGDVVTQWCAIELAVAVGNKSLDDRTGNSGKTLAEFDNDLVDGPRLIVWCHWSSV